MHKILLFLGLPAITIITMILIARISHYLKKKKAVARRVQVGNELTKIIERASRIDPDKFHYSCFVKGFNSAKQCGTLCCLIGWYPKIFPESNIVWSEESWTTLAYKGKDEDLSLQGGEILRIVSEFHNIPERMIRAITSGTLLHDDKGDIVVSDISVPAMETYRISQLIKRINTVREAVLIGRLDDLLTNKKYNH